MALLVGSGLIGAALLFLAAVRIARVASWRTLAMVAISTGSLKACVEFLRYCDRL